MNPWGVLPGRTLWVIAPPIHGSKPSNFACLMKQNISIIPPVRRLFAQSLNTLQKWYHQPYAHTVLAWLTWIAGMTITALVSFPNHYYFRTYGYDLGYVVGMFENISRGNPIGTVYHSGEVPHIFYAVYILGLPFYWIGGVWGVLAYQWIAIGIGAWGIYQYTRLKVGSLAWLSMLHYWGMWGIYGALSYDVHPEVVGPCLVPWIFYTLETKKRILLYALTLIALFSKHTVSIWLFFVFIFLYLYYGKQDIRRRYALHMVIVSFTAILISFAINSLFEEKFHFQSRFSVMYSYLWSDNPLNPTHYAESLSEKAKYLIKNWYYIWAFLWESPRLDPASIGIKSEVYLSILMTGGWSFMLMPLLIIPIIPLIAYKSLAYDYQVWGILYHYNMEYAVYVPIAFAIWLSTKSGRSKIYLFILAVLMTHIWLLHLMESTVYKWYSPEQMVWYRCKHYTSPYDYRRIHEGLKIIPKTSYVTAVSRLLPHFPPDPGRQFHLGFCENGAANCKSNEEGSPVFIDPRTEYMVLLREETNPWPLNTDEYYALIEYLSHSPGWRLIYDRDKLLIFRRNALSNPNLSTVHLK